MVKYYYDWFIKRCVVNRFLRSKKHGSTPRRGRSWRLQDAKTRFSELFRLARSSGPQWVTKQGKESVVILPVEQFDEFMKRRTGPKSLTEFFAQSPLVGAGVKFEREADHGHTIVL